MTENVVRKEFNAINWKDFLSLEGNKRNMAQFLVAELTENNSTGNNLSIIIESSYMNNATQS